MEDEAGQSALPRGAVAQASKEPDGAASGSSSARRTRALPKSCANVFPLGAGGLTTDEPSELVGAAVDTLTELLSASRATTSDALLARSQHIDLTAERAWATAYACETLEDAVACLERFRRLLLDLLSSSAEDLLGTAGQPLHVHLVFGTGAALHCAAPKRVLIARSVEGAEVLMAAVALANWSPASLAMAVPALPTALRDLCVQTGIVGTARPAICDTPGVAPLSRSMLTADAFAARGGAEASATARRSLWVDFVESLVARYGVHSLVKLAGLELAGPFAPAAAVAALETGARTCFKGAQSFSLLLQDWASKQWETMALDTPNEWVGGVGSLVTFRPSAVNCSDVEAKSAKGEEMEAPVMQMSVAMCWKWMLSWLWTEKRSDLLWCIAAILWACIWTVYGPVLLSDLISETSFVASNIPAEGLPNKTAHGGLLPDFIVTQHFKFIVALVACMFSGQAISVIMGRQLSIKAPCNPGFTLELGLKMTQHLSTMPQLFLDTANLKKVADVIEEDIMLIGQAVASSFTAVYCALILAASLGLMFTIEKVLTVVLIGLLPLYGIFATIFGRRNGKMSTIYRREERSYKAYKEEHFYTSSVARTLGLSAAFNAALTEKAEACLERSDELSVHTAVLQACLATISTAFMTFLLGWGAFLICSNKLSVGSWIAFYSAVGTALPLVPQLAEALRQWFGAQEALVMLRGLGALRGETFNNASSPEAGVSIVLQDLCYTFFASPGPVVLANANATVPRGGKVALCGRSGAGKTTLLRLLCRLYQPTSGRVLINGVCLNEMDAGSLIAMVEQEVVLFDLSILENIRIAKPSASDDEVAAVAAAAAIASDIETLHGGYTFGVGLRGKFLSGGQRQRVGIARALLRDTPVLLLDEPVSAQDKENMLLIAKTVTSLRRKNGDAVTVISSSHSLEFFEQFTFGMYVANRTIVEWGAIEELKASRGLLFQLFNSQEGMNVDSSGRVELDASKLRSVWLFATVPAAGLKKLASMFTTRKLRDGDVLYGAGDAQDTIYVIASGRIAFREPQLPGKSDKPLTLYTLEPGAVFNAESLLHDVMHSHEACAESPAVLCACARAHFEQILQLNPLIGDRVTDMVRRRAEYLAPASLRTAWPLCRLSDDDASLLAESFRLDVVPARTQLFCAPASVCSALFVVLHGTVAVTRGSAVDQVSAGGLIGATSLVSAVDVEVTHATTTDECVVAVLTAESLANVMKSSPSVMEAVHGVTDHWLAARSPEALSQLWLTAPLHAACASSEGAMEPFRALSAAVTTRLTPTGALHNLTPTVCVDGKLVAKMRPPGIAPELRELETGGWCASELLLADNTSWTESAESAESCVVACLPSGALSRIAADFPGVEDAIRAMLAQFRAGLAPAALAALGLNDLSEADLAMLPCFCSAHVLPRGKAVFEDRNDQPWIARVLWGEVRGTSGTLLKAGATFCNERAALLATGVPADASAKAAGSEASRAQLLAEAAASNANGSAPKAVLLLFDLGALMSESVERRRRAAELQAAADARAAQIERIRALRREITVLCIAMEQGEKPETSTPSSGAVSHHRRGVALFRHVALRIALACRLRSSATIAGSLDDAEAQARSQLAAVQEEFSRRVQERAGLVALLRAAWAELEVLGSPMVPPHVARALAATSDGPTRAGAQLLRDALDAVKAVREARAADIAAALLAVKELLVELGPDIIEAPDSPAQIAARLAAAGLQRAVLDESLALLAALHAEREQRLALQADVRRELSEVCKVLSNADELANLPAPQPTLAVLRAHREALARAQRLIEPGIAAARDDLTLLWAQLDIPTGRRAPLLPTRDEIPSAALLKALKRELRHLNDAADIVQRLMASSSEPPANEPYRTVGGVLVGSIRIGARRVRESEAMVEEATQAQPAVDAIAAALYAISQSEHTRESAAAVEAERVAEAEIAATAKRVMLREAALARSSERHDS